MNDFENKLRSRKFLPPPVHVRRQVLAAGEDGKASRKPETKTWSEWLWPSPLAWGAVASVLLGALIFNANMPSPRVPAATARAITEEPRQTATFVFFQDRQNLDWLLENR